ncbi:MAG: tRNA pseudouridine(55) synthase TruB [Bacillota bacterium]|nr:tRNA pseudouridine(55) synthase TruB [Bacillota bacterium]
MNGVIVIDKDKGFTSHDVVAKMRRILGTKKIGHTGTLDPDATGVLPVCIGNATKASDIMTGGEIKGYLAELRLGITTDTLDASGKVLESKSTEGITDNDISEAIKLFTGEIKQLPPMYSAIKVGGKKLYQLARQGIEIERQLRDITIYKLDIVKREDSLIYLDVECSKGTYIRSLCADIGEALGCGGHMAALRRTRSGNFTTKNAVTLEELEKSQDKLSYLIPTDELFDYPKMVVTEKQEKLIRNGVAAYCEAAPGNYRVYSGSGEFLAVSNLTDIDGKLGLKLIKSFY